MEFPSRRITEASLRRPGPKRCVILKFTSPDFPRRKNVSNHSRPAVPGGGRSHRLFVTNRADHNPLDVLWSISKSVHLGTAIVRIFRVFSCARISNSMNWVYWSLLSTLFAAATAILAKLGVANINSNLAAAVRTSVVFFLAWGIALAEVPVSAIAGISRRTLLFLVLSGLATGLSWVCYFRALQIGEASQVAPVDKLSVVFVLVFAAIFLGERITFATVAGGLLIAAGAVILALS